MEAGNNGNYMPLEGRRMVITGGGSPNGIGAATARICAERGAHVVIGDINGVQAKETAKLLNDAGLVHVSAAELDVTEMDSVTRFMRESSERMGGINVVFANAGITRDKGFMRMDEKMFEDVINVNLTGVYRTIHEALPYILEQAQETGNGRVIATSSVVGDTGNIGQANYGPAKAGVQNLMKTLAMDPKLARTGVTYNWLNPGFCKTEMTAGMDFSALAAVAERIPAGRLGEADDIAKGVAFLASPDADYISGYGLTISGGFHI